MSSRGIISSPYAGDKGKGGKGGAADKASDKDKNAPTSTSSHSQSSPLFLLTLFSVILAGVGVFGLNYWHSVRCHEAHSTEELTDMFQALQSRLLHVESQTLASSIEMEKFVSVMGEKLAISEDSEMDKLKAHKSEAKGKHSGGISGIDLMKIVYDDDTVTKVQLALAKQPSPLKHKFHLDQKYTENADALFDKINEILVAVDADGGSAFEEHHSDAGARGDEKDVSAQSILQWATDDLLSGSGGKGKGKGKGKDEGSYFWEEGAKDSALPPSEMTVADLLSQREKEHQDDDFLYIPSASEMAAARGTGGSNEEKLRDQQQAGRTNIAKDPKAVAAAVKKCNEWLKKYDVVMQVSWGSLPYDLQDAWLDIGCDSYINKVSQADASASADTGSVST